MTDESRSANEIRDAFLSGESAATRLVRDWIAGIVRGGWRFADPDAVIQAVVVELLELARRGAIRSDTSFRSYVQTVTRHSCVDAYRRERLRRTDELDDQHFEVADETSADPHTRIELSQQLERLRFIWQGLAPACRELLRWAYADEVPSAEIARRLQISAGNARVRLHRCLERARELRREHYR